MIRSILCILALLFAISASVQAAEMISGQARAISGDTIEVQGTRIRLHGIDAPHLFQHCFLDQRVFGNRRSYDDRRRWSKVDCGRRAKHTLQNQVRDLTVRCERTRASRKGSAVARCWVGDVDLSAAMVSSGWAVAARRFSNDYVAEENDAKSNQRGLWRLEFDSPSLWEPKKVNQKMTWWPVWLLLVSAVLLFSAVIGTFVGLVWRFVLYRSKLSSVLVAAGTTVGVTIVILAFWIQPFGGRSGVSF